MLFYSNIFSKDVRKIMPFARMLRVVKRNAALVIPALEFTMQARGGGEVKLLFTSFFGHYRESCYTTCLRLHRSHRPDLYSPRATGSGSGGGQQRDARVTLPASAAPGSGDSSTTAGGGGGFYSALATNDSIDSVFPLVGGEEVAAGAGAGGDSGEAVGAEGGGGEEGASGARVPLRVSASTGSLGGGSAALTAAGTAATSLMGENDAFDMIPNEADAAAAMGGVRSPPPPAAAAAAGGKGGKGARVPAGGGVTTQRPVSVVLSHTHHYRSDGSEVDGISDHDHDGSGDGDDDGGGLPPPGAAAYRHRSVSESNIVRRSGGGGGGVGSSRSAGDAASHGGRSAAVSDADAASGHYAGVAGGGDHTDDEAGGDGSAPHSPSTPVTHASPASAAAAGSAGGVVDDHELLLGAGIADLSRPLSTAVDRRSPALAAGPPPGTSLEMVPMGAQQQRRQDVTEVDAGAPASAAAAATASSGGSGHLEPGDAGSAPLEASADAVAAMSLIMSPGGVQQRPPRTPSARDASTGRPPLLASPSARARGAVGSSGSTAKGGDGLPKPYTVPPAPASGARGSGTASSSSAVAGSAASSSGSVLLSPITPRGRAVSGNATTPGTPTTPMPLPPPLPPIPSLGPEYWGALPPPPGSLWERIGRMKVCLDTVLPCAPSEFHDHFVADTAGFPMSDFHHGRGDLSITATPWAETGGGGGDPSAAAAGGGGRHGHGHGHHHHHGHSGSGKHSGGGGGDPDAVVVRTMRLRMPLEPHPMAPKETRVEKAQRYSQHAGPVLVLDTSARSLDIPYGDYFVSEDSLLVAPVDLALPSAAFKGGGAALPPLPPPEAIDRARRLLREWGVSETVEPPEAAAGADGGAAPASQQSPAPAPVRRLCRLVATVYINFSKGTLLKGTISSRAEARIAAFEGEFAAAATRYLQGFYAQRAAAVRAWREAAAGGAASASAMTASPPPFSTAPGGGRGGAGAPPAEGELATLAAPGAGLAAPMHPAVAALKRDAVATADGTRLTSPGGHVSEFLSPTAAAALADPTLAIEKDALMAAWMSPRAAPAAAHAELVRQYTQLYAVHEAMVLQTRKLQRAQSLPRPEGGDGGGGPGSARAGSPRGFGSSQRATGANEAQQQQQQTLAAAWAAGPLPFLLYVLSLSWLGARPRALLTAALLCAALLPAVFPRHSPPLPLLPPAGHHHSNNHQPPRAGNPSASSSNPMMMTTGGGAGGGELDAAAADRVAELVWQRMQAQLGAAPAARVGGAAAESAASHDDL